MKKITLILLLFCSVGFAQCYSEIESKVHHNLALRPDGTLWAWGWNDYDQLGDNSNADQPTPVQIGTDGDWISVHAGTEYSLAIKSDGTLWGWGNNEYGQSKGQSGSGADVPELIGTDSDWVTAAAGLYFSAAIKSDGTLWMWGSNPYGQLGDGTTINNPIPQQVGTDNDWLSVSLGSQQTIALKSNGTIWGWGINAYGNLGIGNFIDQHTPAQIGTDNQWVKICAGYSSSFGIKADGTLWAWGSNTFGAIGNGGSPSTQNTPLQVGTNTWSSISATHHCLAIRSDGTLWSWGRNQSGEVGNGNPGVNQTTPLQVGTASDWIKADAGFYHSIALRGNGSLWTWGKNEYGTLGNGTFTDNLTPSLAGTICGEELCTIDTPELPAIASECTIDEEDLVVPTTTDSCGETLTAELWIGNFPITEQGTSSVIWRFSNGATSKLVAQEIVIDDTQAPAPALASLPDHTAVCSVAFDDLTIPTATDNCMGEIEGTISATFPIAAQGTTVITWLFIDGNGNSSTQTQNIIIDDTVAPVANLSELPIITAQCEITGIIPPTAIDNCAGSLSATTSDPASYTEQGMFSVTWTYNDGNGNTVSQVQTIIIDDTTPPVASVEELPVLTADCTVSGITAPTAIDNCAGTITATTSDPLSYDQQGSFNITWIYSDGNGNTTTQTQEIVIEDTTAPLPTVADLPILTGQCGIESVTAPLASDACSGSITATTTDSLSYDEQGTYTITWTFNDENGNSTTQIQNVVIDDDTDPVASAQDIEVDLDGSPSVSITPGQIDNSSSDNCSELSFELSNDTFPDTGVYEVVLTVTDAAGNSATAIAEVTVIDSSLGVIDTVRETIKVYPVPAAQTLYIQKPSDVIVLSTSLYDLLGRKIYETQEYKSSIDVSAFSRSEYYLIIETPEGTYKKLIMLK